MSETKRYGSVEVLCEKILHEAEDYKNDLLEKTSSEAKGISEEYEKKAQAAKDEILSRAEEKAAESRRTADSAEETARRQTFRKKRAFGGGIPQSGGKNRTASERGGDRPVPAVP